MKTVQGKRGVEYFDHISAVMTGPAAAMAFTIYLPGVGSRGDDS